jgi:hypothetical protein
MSGFPPAPTGASSTTKLLYFLAAVVGLLLTLTAPIEGFMGNWSAAVQLILPGLPAFLLGLGGLWHVYFDGG